MQKRLAVKPHLSLEEVEHLWPLSNEPLVNRHFRDLDELEEVQAERCVFLQDSPDLIRSHTSFHWWPHPREKLSSSSGNGIKRT